MTSNSFQWAIGSVSPLAEYIKIHVTNLKTYFSDSVFGYLAQNKILKSAS